MFWSYSRASVTDGDLESTVVFGKRDMNRTVFGSESQRVIEQISHRAFEQVGVGINLSIAAATNCHVTILRQRLIERCDLFDRSARVELLQRDRFARGIDPRDKK